MVCTFGENRDKDKLAEEGTESNLRCIVNRKDCIFTWKDGVSFFPMDKEEEEEKKESVSVSLTIFLILTLPG